MMIQRLFVGLACAGTFAAQTFIQMSDPQFGMFTKNASFEHETGQPGVRHREREPLKPAFVAITGDPIDDPVSFVDPRSARRTAAL
jgi:hypothetical protein